MTAIVHPPLAETSSGERAPSSGRLLFRFGVGLVELASQRLLEALRAVGGLAPDPSAPLPPPAPTSDATARHVVVGMLVSVPSATVAALRSLEPAGATLARLGKRGGRALAHLPGGRSLGRRWHVMRADGNQAVARFAALGRAEAEEGRRLAQEFLSGASEAAVARVADSPELKRVIGEQSQGLAVTAVNELRERSARADSLAESVVRRLGGHSRSGGSK